MKKSILFLSFLALLSCNKTKQEITNTTNDNIAESNVHLVEMNSQQISEIITPKQNDTIYITNFFATWCGPCMHEIPFFKEKMEELNGEKVKFTFISVDRQEYCRKSICKRIRPSKKYCFIQYGANPC